MKWKKKKWLDLSENKKEKQNRNFFDLKSSESNSSINFGIKVTLNNLKSRDTDVKSGYLWEEGLQVTLPLLLYFPVFTIYCFCSQQKTLFKEEEKTMNSLKGKTEIKEISL